MANRLYDQFQGSLEKRVVQLFAEIRFNNLGVPSLVRGKGLSYCTKNGTGSFILKLEDVYFRLLGFSAMYVSLGYSEAPDVVLYDLDVDRAEDPTLHFRTYSAGVLTDPREETLLLTIYLSNSSVPL